MIDRIPRALTRPAMGLSRTSMLCQCLRSHQPHTQPLPNRILQLSRLQSQRRLYSTPTPAPRATEHPTEPTTETSPRPPPRDLRSQLASSIPPPKAPRRRFRNVVYAALFLMLGMTAGQYVRWIIAPPDLPQPGSREDAALTASLHKMASKLPLVQSLAADATWRTWPAYRSIPDAERPHRLTTGPLAGARGVGGYQQVFENAQTGEVIVVVWVGGAMAGWPGVAHGGFVATVLDETLGRCAFQRLEAGSKAVTASMELKLMAPTVTNSFVVVRATPMMEGATERKQWVSGRVERVDGRVCVEAKALYVAPKQTSLKGLGEEF